MKKFSSVAVLLWFLFNNVSAQTLTWSGGVANLVYHHCTVCHHNDGIAPFALESYHQATLWSTEIHDYVNGRKMPPWSPDPSYRHYANERALSQSQIDSIVNWINDGMPEGNSVETPPVPHFGNGYNLGTPDMKLTIPLHVSQGYNNDEYACIILPAGIDEDKYVRAIQIVPGDPSIVHHVIVTEDTTANLSDCYTSLLSAEVMTSWAAGMAPTVFPEGAGLRMGERLKKGSNIMLQIHYPKGSGGKVDSTSVLFYFYSDSAVASNNPPMREIYEGYYVMNWVFYIAPNTTQTIKATYPAIGQTTEDVSLFSVDPHMHLVGRSAVSFAVTPNHDTIPLARVNDWQFNWQGYYTFRNLIHIPAGSVLYGSAFYDNTSNNPYNPNNPPQAILPGEQTSNEMMLTAFQYAKYQPGDENYNIDSLVELPENIVSGVPELKDNAEQAKAFVVYPNPSAGQFTFFPSNLDNGKTEITVTDVLGKQVMFKQYEHLNSPIDLSLLSQPDGIYLVQVNNGAYHSAQRIVIAAK